MSNCIDQSFGYVIKDNAVTNLKVNNVTVTKELNACNDNSNLITAQETYSAVIDANEVFVNGEELKADGGGVGPQGPPGPPGPMGATLLGLAGDITGSRLFFGSEFSNPNLFFVADGPAPGVVRSAYFDLGVSGITSAWVDLNYLNFGVGTNSPPVIPRAAGSYHVRNERNLLGSSIVYVTEDYTEAKRYSSNVFECDPSGSYVGAGTLRQTYNDLGGWIFGTYNNGGEIRCITCNLFPGNPQAYFFIRAIYLDNTSGPTTRVVFDFEKTTGQLISDFVANNNIVVAVYYNE